LQQILRCSRFGIDDQPVTSVLDSLEDGHLQEIKALIAAKPSEELLGQIFWSPNSVHQVNAVPINSVFNRLHASVGSEGANLGFQNAQAPAATTREPVPTNIAQQRVSAFDRLQEPESSDAAQQRVSAFDRLQFSQAQERTSAFDRLQPPAQPAQGPRRFCPRCLQHGHLRRNCWNKIRCHGCNKSGHIKKDCRAALNNIWILKAVNQREK
jgi:hypothetical protein